MNKKSKKVKIELNLEKFGHKMKMLRTKYNLTQGDVAKRIGKVRSLYAGCERGAFSPSTDVLLSLRQLFIDLGEKNVSLDWMLGFSDSQEGAVVRVQSSNEPELRKQIEDLKKELDKAKRSGSPDLLKRIEELEKSLERERTFNDMLMEKSKK